MKMNGTNLLTAYRQSGSQDAFSELVRRYANLVFSVAKRRLSSCALAEEVSQLVFIRLAKASPKIKGEAKLLAWLHRTTVHAAIDLWRSETRRRTREQHAVTMEPPPTENAGPWEEIAPHLDEALDQLSDADRQAVLLRFFDRKTMRDIGRIFSVSEDAAKMRVSRAIDRLRTQLADRGVTCTVVALGTVLAERSVEAAPNQLVASLNAAKVAAGAGTTSSAFALLLALISKAKLAAVLAVLATIGVIGIRQVMQSSTTSEETTVAPEGTPDVDNIQGRLRAQYSSRQGGVNDVSPQAPRGATGAQLEDAKQELRALLTMPPHGGKYPPPALVRVLQKFGEQVHEAMPILVNALGVQDYETRAWAISGVQRVLHSLRTTPGAEERAKQAFELARPSLNQILQSPDEPDLLRMIAVSTYLGTPKPASLTAESVEDLLASLYAPEKKSSGFRFTIVDMLSGHFANQPEDAATFVAAMQQLLNSSNSRERFLAAFALASWPGEKPTAVKDVLVGELEAKTSSHSYRAAQGIGKLGEPAADTVPQLLAYAEATKDWSSGYDESALEAACRLQPELRSQYPEIDAKLKQVEAARLQTMTRTMEIIPLDAGEVASTLADPEKGAALLQGMLSSVAGSPEPEKVKAQFLASFDQLLASASDDQRFAIQSAIEALQQTDASPEEPIKERAPFPMANLVTTARVLLLESAHPNKDRLEAKLNELQCRQNATDTGVTTERFQSLSKTICDFDSEFHAAWQKQVLKDYPWLDRILPPGEK